MSMSMSMSMETLPEDCVSKIVSYTSPTDACRFSMVSSTLRLAANSDLVWQTFFPSDYHHIISRALINPMPLINSSNDSYKKNLFYALCRPILLDGGNMSFKLDKISGKKSYILSARQLSITWSNDPLYWTWKPMPESRFKEVAELRTVSWLEIQGKIRTGILTANTSYAVYLIMNISHRVYGLDSAPSNVSVTITNRAQSGKVYLCQRDENEHDKETQREMLLENTLIQEKGIKVPTKREDGWMEIEMGEFFSGENDEEINMSLIEVGYQLKGGLIVEGIEVRPN